MELLLNIAAYSLLRPFLLQLHRQKHNLLSSIRIIINAPLVNIKGGRRLLPFDLSGRRPFFKSLLLVLLIVSARRGSTGVAHGPRAQTRMGEDASITGQGELGVLEFGLHGDLRVVLKRLADVLVVNLLLLADIQVSLFYGQNDQLESLLFLT